MSFEVQGKTALVTGANRGIGKAIVETLFKHGAAKVYAAVRNPASLSALQETYGDKLVPVRVDLSSPETIREAATTASDVSLVVNNAGVLKIADSLAEDAVDNLRFELDVNLFGLVHMARAFAPVLKANGGGAFVQLNSVVSMKTFPEVTTYSASKAAAYSVTQGLRATLGEQGTQVVSVHPGPIATDMASDAGFEEMAEPPELVGESIVAALAAGEFHAFPDSMAKQIGEAYQSFAENVVEAEMSEA